MKLGMARLCIDCDEVHDSRKCPVCQSDNWALIQPWLTERKEPEPDLPAQEAEELTRL